MATSQITSPAEQESFFRDRDDLDGFLEDVSNIAGDYVGMNDEISRKKVDRMMKLLEEILGKGVPEKRGAA